MAYVLFLTQGARAPRGLKALKRKKREKKGGKGILKRERIKNHWMDLVHESQNGKGLHVPNQINQMEA